MVCIGENFATVKKQQKNVRELYCTLGDFSTLFSGEGAQWKKPSAECH